MLVSLQTFVHPLLCCAQWNISNGCIVLATGSSEQLVTASLWQMSARLFVAQAPPPDGLMLEGWGNYITGLLGKLGTSLTASDRCDAGVPFSCFSLGSPRQIIWKDLIIQTFPLQLSSFIWTWDQELASANAYQVTESTRVHFVA